MAMSKLLAMLTMKQSAIYSENLVFLLNRENATYITGTNHEPEPIHGFN